MFPSRVSFCLTCKLIGLGCQGLSGISILVFTIGESNEEKSFTTRRWQSERQSSASSSSTMATPLNMTKVLSARDKSYKNSFFGVDNSSSCHFLAFLVTFVVLLPKLAS
jgi:hypothetical protein